MKHFYRFLYLLLKFPFVIVCIYVLLSPHAFAVDSEFNWWQRLKGADKDPCRHLSSKEITELRPDYSRRLRQQEDSHKAALNALFYKQNLATAPIEAKAEYLINSGMLEAGEKMTRYYGKLVLHHAEQVTWILEQHSKAKKELCQEMFPNIY